MRGEIDSSNLRRADVLENLSDSLASRPLPQDLINRNILKADSHVSGRIVAAQRELMKRQLEDHLSHKIEDRIGLKDELVNQNILKGEPSLDDFKY